MCVRSAGTHPATELQSARKAQARAPSQQRILRSTTCVLVSAAVLGACSQSTATRDTDLGVMTSARVVSGSRNIPKGGGHYKVGKPYKVSGRWYVPRKDPKYDRSGVASWYGTAFHGRRTANGEIYDMNALTAGHRTLPLPSYAYVTNRKNGRTILVRINDRGPYVNDRIIDLSKRSARELGFMGQGLARVRVRYAGPAPLNGSDVAEHRYLATQRWYRTRRRLADGSALRAQSGGAEPIVTASTRSIARNRNTKIASLGNAFATQRASLGGPPRSYVGAGVFSSRPQAERRRYELKGLGHVAVKPLNSGPKPIFRVQLGPFDEAEAAAVITQIADLGIADRAHILE